MTVTAAQQSSTSGDFGRTLRRLRHAKGMSVTELGYLSGRSAFSVIRWEDGGHVPSATVLVKLAAALGVPTDAFFAADDAEESAPQRRRLARKGQRVAS
jgi:transcriptional regulator with XRE-family HTH domain